MTEKRFKSHIFDDGVNERYPDGIIDNENDEKVICNYQYISYLLNELNDKCEFLEIENESLEDSATKYAELYHKSLKENEQLKSDNRLLYSRNTDLKRKNELYDAENEQLKHDIKNLKLTIEARETLIDVCEKKFKELGYIITVDEDGYVIE